MGVFMGDGGFQLRTMICFFNPGTLSRFGAGGVWRERIGYEADRLPRLPASALYLSDIYYVKCDAVLGGEALPQFWC